MNDNIYKSTREKVISLNISLNCCPRYVHELNCVAGNRSIIETARCLFGKAKGYQINWPKVIKAAAYLENRSLANISEKKISYGIFFNENPSVNI